jgi:tetratricopeptide (TPR) repeat protein
MLSGELELAQNSLLKAITLDGQFINAYIVLAQVQSDLGKTDASIATYERALVLSPGNKDIYRNLALTYSQYGDYDNAIRQYQHVIDIDPRSAFPYAGIIAEYQKQGKQQEVIATCRRAVEALPESVEEFYTAVIRTFPRPHD